MVAQKISKVTLDLLKEEANNNIEVVLSELGVDIDSIQGIDDQVRCACPVHGGDNTTAFSYNTTYKSWRCYTANCHEGNESIFGLVKLLLAGQQDKEVGFRDVVFWLGKLLNVKIDGESSIDSEKIEVNKLLQQAKVKQRVISNGQQKNSREKFDPFPVSVINNKIKPSDYFLNKGFSSEILTKYNVGYCEDNRKPMYLRSFAPVLDDGGKTVIGVTGRIIYEQCETCGNFHEQSNNGCPQDNPTKVKSYPKWLHYGFNTTSVLYNSWFAEPFIKKAATIILTEGPKEVWWFEQLDIHNSCCIFGLNVYPYHIAKLIKMGVTTIVVALDNDERGVDAAEHLNSTIGSYFKLVNMYHLLNNGEDIDDIKADRMKNSVIPFLRSLERKY